MKQRIFQRRILAILTAVLLLSLQWTLFGGQRASAATLNNAAMVTVLDKDGKPIISTSVVKLNKDEKAITVLKELAKQKKVDFQTKVDPNFGEQIVKIGDSEPKYENGGFYWSFYINGSESQVGASSYTVQNGDDLLLKVVSYPAKTIKAKITAKDKNKKEVLPETEVEVVEGTSAYAALKLAAKTKKLNLKLRSIRVSLVM